MGLLEDILARSQYMAQPGAFPLPIDEAAEAEAARAAAGQRLILANRRRPPNPLTLAPDADAAGVQLALGNAPEGTGVPFSTAAGMLAPPMTMPGPADPLPPPIEVGPTPTDAVPETATDFTSRARGGGSAGPAMQIAPLAPGAGQMVMPPDAQPSLLDRIRGGLSDNSNTLLALGAGLAGAPSIGQGISRAAAAAIPARAADIKQKLALQGQASGVKALVDVGVPLQQAIAAQSDPELKKALIKNYIEDRAKKIVKIGTDRYGADIMAEHDPFTGKLTPINAQALVAGAGGTAAPTAENDVTGPDYLQRLQETDPAYARQVEAIRNGDMPFPTGRQAQTPLGRRLIQDVLTVEPGLSAADFKTRQDVRSDYTKGKSALVTKSINTVLEHAQRLEKSINELDNSNFLPSVTNRARNVVRGELDPKYQAARGAYQTDAANFAKELDFAVSGGRPTVSGTKHQMEGFDLTKPKAEQIEKLREGVELLKGRLDSHAIGYGKGMRRNVEGIDFIDPNNRQFYQRLTADQAQPTGESPPGVRAAPAGAAPAARNAAPVEPTATDPKTGRKAVYRNGAWQIVQ